MIHLLPVSLHHHLETAASRWLQPDRLGAFACRLPPALNRRIVEAALNRVFAQQLEEGDFDFLQDRRVGVEIRDARIHVVLGHDGRQLKCLGLSRARQATDACLSLDSGDAIALVRQQVDPDTLFFQRRLKISGDAALAHQLKNTIDALETTVLPAALLKLLGLYREKLLQAENRGTDSPVQAGSTVRRMPSAPDQ